MDTYKNGDRPANVEFDLENAKPKPRKPSNVGSKFEESARLVQSLEKVYTRKNKVVIVMPLLNFNTPLDEISMSSNDSFRINLKVCVLSPKTSTLGIDANLESVVLNPQVRRYPLRT